MPTLEALTMDFLLENKTRPDLKEGLVEEVEAWIAKSVRLDVSGSAACDMVHC